MAAGKLRIRLLPKGEAAVRSGHPWVFAESIKSTSRDGQAGDLAAIYDRRDRLMALGFYDPKSPIRIRVIHVGEPVAIDRDWWLAQVATAFAKRQELLDQRTSGARLINGESEGLPGLIADLYDRTLVVKLYTASWLVHWPMIEDVLRTVIDPEHLVLRLSRKVSGDEGFSGRPGEPTVEFLENGLRFESAVLNGQKTGFFLDQRENRGRVEALATGRRILNLFSFSGGFSLYAARGGAKSVVDLDISRHALEAANRNFSLNPELSSVPRETIQTDAFRWITEPGEQYDLIVVDPPSLAKRRSELEGAISAYRHLNTAAIRRLNPGGILVASSCTAQLSAATFFELVTGVARRSSRAYQQLWTSGHPSDHPAAFQEVNYLKAICLRMGD